MLPVAEAVEEALVDVPVPVLPTEVVVLPVPTLLIEEPVPVLLEMLNGSVMTVSIPGNGQHGRHTHSSVGDGTSANITSIVASMLMIKMPYFSAMSSACKISSAVKDVVNFAE